MHIHDLLLANGVELSHALTGWCFEGLFEVRGQAGPGTHGVVGDVVLLVEVGGGLGSFCLLVEGLESGCEAGRVAMLRVEVNSAGDGLVADGVAVGKVFGEDASAGLVFLRELFA